MDNFHNSRIILSDHGPFLWIIDHVMQENDPQNDPKEKMNDPNSELFYKIHDKFLMIICDLDNFLIHDTEYFFRDSAHYRV